MRRLVSQFVRSESGTTATIFALMCLPLMATVGMAVDGARWYNARQRTSEAVDAAVLVAARRLQLDETDQAGALQAAREYYTLNSAKRTPTMRDSITFELTDNESAVQAVGTASIATTLLGAIGISELAIYEPAAGKSAKAAFRGELGQGSNMEIAMVLDFTGSMCDTGFVCSSGTKLQGLRDAAKELVDIIVKPDQSKFTSRVALVPFTSRIRVASDSSDGTLMQKLTNLPKTWSGYVEECSKWVYSGSAGGGEIAETGTWTCTGTKSNVLKSNWKINPCVTERIYTEDWNADDDLDYTDRVPSTDRWLMATAGNRWPFYPNSLDANPNPNPSGGNTSPVAQWNYSESPGCYEAPEANALVPLSSDKTDLKAKIDAFSADGATAGPLGTSFAWYMLSPSWSSIWPATSAPGAYSDLKAKTASGAPVLRKVAVIMTDGVYNTMRGNKGLTQNKVAQHAERLCDEMKNQGIEIYTVGFALDQLNGSERSTAENMLRKCGSSVKHFYSTLNVTQLRGAFRDIGLRLMPIRLTQ